MTLEKYKQNLRITGNEVLEWSIQLTFAEKLTYRIADELEGSH